MQKKFMIGKLSMKEDLTSPLIIAYRSNNKIYHQNIALPEGSELKWNEKDGEFIIKFKMKEGEVLSLGNASGMADKGVLK